MRYNVLTTYFEGGEVRASELFSEPLDEELEAHDGAIRYVMTLVAGAKEHGPAQVQAVGRDGWRVTLPDGWEETVQIVHVP